VIEMAILPLIRLVVFTATLVFAVIVLALSAHLTSLTAPVVFDFEGLGIAVGVLSLITMPVMIGVDFARRGAFTSMVLVELIWTFILWVLWIATAALAAEESQISFGDFSASCNFENTIVAGECHELAAIEAFSFLAWLLLMGYNITLLVFAIMGASRGNRTWTSSVGDGLLTPKGGEGVAPVSALSTGTGYSTAPTTTQYSSPQTMQYPPQQQQPYYGQPAQPSPQPMTAQV
jgi:hypothetical protein